MLHLDNEFAVTKIRLCLLACTPQLYCPGRHEFPFQNQPTPPVTINKRNFEHCFFLHLRQRKARTKPAEP
jgi:hypothetical protein